MNTLSHDLLKRIEARTSYRGQYQSTPVPRGDLIKIMKAGLSAPSGCNKQTTSLIAVDDPELVCKLKGLLDPPICQTAPAFLCVLTQQIIAYRDRSYYVQDYSAAIQNMLLAINALGYESCWYEGHITDEDDIAGKIAKLLNVPESYRLVCLLPVGKASQQVKPRTDKKSFAERAWFNGFQNTQG